MKVALLAYDGCTPSMIAGVLDILSFANDHYRATKKGDLFDVSIVTETGQPANGFSKFPIQAQQSIKAKSGYDLIYIPGFMGELDKTLSQQKKLIDWVSKQHQKGVTLAAACNGNFLLAETGALDKRKATTHWSLIGTFKQRYKKITVEPEKIVIDNGPVLSAAGVTAYFNLAISLVERYGSKDLALASAKVFLVDSGRKIQTPYQMFHVTKNHGDDEIVQVQEWLEANYTKAVTLEKLTQVCNLTKKTLTRRFKMVTGDSPMSYLQKLRIENAKRMLESKKVAFNEITWRVGYNDISSFHKVFKSETGLTPIEYRTKFSLV